MCLKSSGGGGATRRRPLNASEISGAENTESILVLEFLQNFMVFTFGHLIYKTNQNIPTMSSMSSPNVPSSGSCRGDD